MTRHTSVPIPKGMDEQKFDVSFSEGEYQPFRVEIGCWCVSRQRTRFKIIHQVRNETRGSEGEPTLTDVHLTIFAGPRVDSAQPALMKTSDIFSRKSLILPTGLERHPGRV